jgi:hypothetical protein
MGFLQYLWGKGAGNAVSRTAVTGAPGGAERAGSGAPASSPALPAVSRPSDHVKSGTAHVASWCDHIIMFGNEWMLYGPDPPCSAKRWNYCPVCGAKRPDGTL